VRERERERERERDGGERASGEKKRESQRGREGGREGGEEREREGGREREAEFTFSCVFIQFCELLHKQAFFSRTLILLLNKRETIMVSCLVCIDSVLADCFLSTYAGPLVFLFTCVIAFFGR
jgi:hypothetical protein